MVNLQIKVHALSFFGKYRIIRPPTKPGRMNTNLAAWKGTAMNKVLMIGIFTLVVLMFTGQATCYAESDSAKRRTFHKGVLIKASDKPIDVEIGHLVPRVCDWNNDGKKDLLVGQFRNGAISLFLNEGTNKEPIFKDSSFLHAGGKPIKLDAG